MYTEHDLIAMNHRYNIAVNEWQHSKTRWLENIKWLKGNKGHLPTKQYNKLKRLTKQTRVDLQQDIENNFQKKIDLYEKVREIENYLSTEKRAQDDEIFSEVLVILGGMTDRQKEVFLKRKHTIEFLK